MNSNTFRLYFKSHKHNMAKHSRIPIKSVLWFACRSKRTYQPHIPNNNYIIFSSMFRSQLLPNLIHTLHENARSPTHTHIMHRSDNPAPMDTLAFPKTPTLHHTLINNIINNASDSLMDVYVCVCACSGGNELRRTNAFG